MKTLIHITLTLFLIASLIPVLSGCSSRNETPTYSEDSTIVYSPNQPDGVNANITLCRKVGKKTGKRIDTGTVFTIKEKTKIHAFFDIENRNIFADKEIMFHVEWIGPDGKSFYRKRIDLLQDDSSSTINSSISITPAKRQQGSYKVRFFLFRELIAEKKFELRDFVPITGKEFDITANITLCRKVGKKTGKRIGAGTVFTIKKKAKVRAIIDLENRDDYLDKELKFKVEWIEPNGKSFYRKKIDFSPGDSTSTIKSSISITPKKRQPGNYIFRVYLYNTLLAEKKFELR
ncbi:MAG: hypothetical protein DRQ01_07765, partial [Ignavibacteriae bacterium]